ncbi:hypothetical protein BJY04DRAFT_30599 [Aspergillus karnatakaensis]|uniref:uncharacterized protein n=1 Tax=Aspergillus karnatakaensis TaxID=1810916 RepID=UPI003CCE0CE6
MTSTKRKSPDDAPATSPSAPRTISFTARNPQWTYFKLQLITQPPPSQPTPIDPLTARTYLTSALSQFLGFSGTAIPIDILHVTPSTTIQPQTSTSSQIQPQPPYSQPERYIWIRVPHQDAPALVSALSSWIGDTGDSESDTVAWRICAKGNFLPALVHGDGADLFAS